MGWTKKILFAFVILIIIGALLDDDTTNNTSTDDPKNTHSTLGKNNIEKLTVIDFDDTTNNISTDDPKNTHSTLGKSNIEKLTVIDFEDSSVSNPYLYKDKIVFDMKKDIYLYDIPSRTHKEITYDNIEQSHPYLENNTVYWLEGNSIWTFDLLEEKSQIYETDIDFKSYTEYHFGSYSAECYENICVHSGYIKNISSNKITWFLDMSKVIINPSIWKNKIVWSGKDQREKNYNIFFYDLETNETKQISSTKYLSEREPAIYEENIVFLRQSEDESQNDICLYNLNTQEEQIIDKTNNEKYRLQIFGDYIIWVEYKDPDMSDNMIYLYEI